MSNICVTEIIIRGESKNAVYDLLQSSRVHNQHGWIWNLREYKTVIFCHVKHGDGITAEDDFLKIRGETMNSLPLTFIQQLSSTYPDLSIEVLGKDVGNLYFQRWRFQEGAGLLIDCIQGAYADDVDPIVYMKDGIQLLKLPLWVAAKGHPAFTDEAEKLRKCLEGTQIATIRIEYDGYGDSGVTYDIECRKKAGSGTPVSDDLREAIIDYLYAVLPDCWETGEGAFGILEFDVATGKSHIVHHERIVDTVTQQFEV